MISFVRAWAAGQAVQIVVSPSPGAVRWRLLRKADDTFTGEDDDEALLVYEGTERGILDAQALANGATYYYRCYDFVDAAWVASATVQCTPAATFLSRSPDALGILRERIDVGLSALVASKVLTHAKGHIQCLLAPPAIDQIVLPVVTLHLTSEAPAERGIGDEPRAAVVDPTGERWDEHDGWLARTEIAVIGWSLNPDERALLGRALRDVVIANLPVFDGLGLSLVEFSLQHVEDFASFNAPMYQVVGQFVCRAPAIVDEAMNEIEDVTVTPIYE